MTLIEPGSPGGVESSLKRAHRPVRRSNKNQGHFSGGFRKSTYLIHRNIQTILNSLIEQELLFIENLRNGL